MWRYDGLLPVEAGSVRYPIPVGGTPLIRAGRLAQEVGGGIAWVKDETRNPSGSTKDRATALILEQGRRDGASTITTASTGNAALATALGAAAVGLRAVLYVPAGCAAHKVARMRVFGADVVEVHDGYSAAVRLSRAAARDNGWIDRNTGTHPLILEGKKTVAFEIWEQLGRRVPDVVVVAVGDGLTISGLARGFREIEACGGTRRVPRLIGVQSIWCQPLVRRWEGGSAAPEELDESATSAQGIAVAEPTGGDRALFDVQATSGGFVAVDEESLRAAATLLARSVGVLAEPAGAACLAGWRAARAGLLVAKEEEVVLVVTGGAGGGPTE